MRIFQHRPDRLLWIVSLAGGISLIQCSSSAPAGGAASGAGAGQSGAATAGSAGQSSTTGESGSAGSSVGGSAAGVAGSEASGGASGSPAGSGGTSDGGNAGAGGGSVGTGGSGGAVDPTKLDKFSFFVTSMVAMRKLSNSQNGFGGDLRYGTADGLSGADKICTQIAESSMPGASSKVWHAFLSTSKVDAATRIGAGPWYDRRQRLLANSLTDLLQDRPSQADAVIKEDLPNETGTPNHRPDPTQPEDDNHHTLTGSNAQGKLYSATATCMDWTSNSTDNKTTGRPRIGFCWSVQGRTNWISGQDEGGCGAGVTGVGTENGGSDPNNPIVGSGGGYGAIYCFAMVP